MNAGLWLSEHRKLITKAITIFLIIISAFFFIYSSYGYIIYFINGKIDNQEEVQVLSPRNVVAPIEVAPIEVFKSGEKYDLAVRVKNPNDNFSAEFSYCINQGDAEVYCDEGFMLPLDNKYLLALATTVNPTNANLVFTIKEIFWVRTNRTEIPDWNAFLLERVNFEIAEVKFLSASKSGLSENLRLNSLEFNALNLTPYSYYQVPFNIFFYAGSELVGVERHVATDVMAGENRQIKISWSGDLGNVSRIEIIPQINVNDKDVYSKYQGLGQ
jgi:hypothetical protein